MLVQVSNGAGVEMVGQLVAVTGATAPEPLVEKLIADQAQIGMADQKCDVDHAIRQLETALRTA